MRFRDFCHFVRRSPAEIKSVCFPCCSRTGRSVRRPGRTRYQFPETRQKCRRRGRGVRRRSSAARGPHPQKTLRVFAAARAAGNRGVWCSSGPRDRLAPRGCESIFLFRPRPRPAGPLVFVRHRRQAADLPPHAKPAATRLYRDIGFSSDTRRKVTPALVAGPGAIAGAGKKAVDFRAARAGFPERGLPATRGSFPGPGEPGRLHPTPPAKTRRRASRAAHRGLYRGGRPVIPSRPPWSPPGPRGGPRRLPGVELPAVEIGRRIAPA